MTQSFIRVTHLSEVDHKQPTSIAIGSFDGVHRGHQALLQRMVAQARTAGMRTAALTFFPHPRRVLHTLPPRFYLTTLDERVHLLAEQGIDLIITHPFDDEVRHIRAADFVDQLLRTLDMKQLWGGNFALGYQREGDVPFLRRQGELKGFTVETLEEPVLLGGEMVSSRRVRRALEAGDMEEVTGCLGRYFGVRGPVVKGDQRGRTIGFPTANLAVWDELLLPGNGVYATYAWVGGKKHAAATNVGVRPTVDGLKLTVEAHILDFDADIYGEQVRLEFVRLIRPEMKFSGLDELKARIAADVAEVRGELL
ncbi:MAG: bifunctional riboflavin kinase/FAD synthetase [Anaerolineae bacterium]|uniref:bifunctional riboflavin kinase/FAD synthetase n=1 Tax=Promineifilum sp. TaxID=2664178 RepID=UPI001DF3B9FD|nr:bifunctional riboflavin kinase/FAD synthetase [Anaerolineales bacterium]MCB8934385.1 bifunctional riboflavin kinase/FAD synthetase [Promineifilum sp.]MCO5181769.1 bifunctional riboflavin kinase/FAD synthetase [Promineifilum sp.]MCW5847347.1 bifunctional riboflavin kinase/FAD synthetase [Anaerolineae bacterium]